MIGVKTIGNATLIAFDDGPVLATDPWLDENGAYFGSWQLPYAIPEQEREDILAAPWVWFSHGHPDHLNPDSVSRFRDKHILLPDHVGRRIHDQLAADGYDVRILPERRWIPLSRRVRVCCVSDYYQDAILLVDVNGRLFVDLNDAKDRAWGGFVRRTVRAFDESYLLKISSFGDTDMINFFDEEGSRILPDAARRRPVGRYLSDQARLLGARYVVPFSVFHKFQRADSVWASEYAVTLDDFAEGFDPSRATLLPAFVEIDCETGDVRPIDPPENPDRVLPPEEFGDDWSDRLEPDDVAAAERYFRQKELLPDKFGFVRLRVGGVDHVIRLDPKLRTGITFEAPRNSLMAAIRWEIFDDLLIGNFMKTTLHGDVSLHPDFTPVVAKWADNGRAQTREAVAEYMRAYRRRAPMRFLMHALERESERRFRRLVSPDSLMFNAAKRAYVQVRGTR